MRILIQIRPVPDVTSAVIHDPEKQTAADVAGDLPGVELDESYPPVALPKPVPKADDGDPLSMHQAMTFSLEPDSASVLVRGEIADDDVASRRARLSASNPDIVGIFSDPVIETMPVCPGDGPSGTWQDVGDRLKVPELLAHGMDGAGVPIAVVDTGINADHLVTAGAEIAVDAARSWTPASASHTPGRFDVGHGTMCAFAAGIAAPQAALLDIALLRTRRRARNRMEALTSDGIVAFAYLRTILESMEQDHKALVVSSNSWGSYDPAWDFPVGDPANYSDNLSHPFNIVVGALESAGADILFAAGNCGRPCPSGKCVYSERTIVGANSHPDVLSIGGVDIQDERVGYSSQGPGRLDRHKPDICAYTHFLGSEVYGPGSADSGTSTACPVAAGVLAAIRSRFPCGTISPEAMREMVRGAANDVTGRGFTDDYGHGIVSVPGLLEKLGVQGLI
ncbi:S8/S53 family peptidase [Streptomyces kaniharaensis]|uniref:S8/S53 family peptidase n=1 Tax=Streptomyces kaniharaensis TaxID=212423 RepID=A0A6N7KWN3_9ACTN|nr:S8/S53 family peptidase [Streptomyces kaniharaensis]MQS14698.1 S8/S53 family peptidase [Streptomyces kaniharaensis]